MYVVCASGRAKGHGMRLERARLKTNKGSGRFLMQWAAEHLCSSVLEKVVDANTSQ